MKRIVIGFLLLVGLVAGAAAQSNADEAAIIKIEDEMVASAYKGEKTLMEKYLAPEYFEAQPNGSVSNRAKVFADFEPIPPELKPSLVFSDRVFEHAGDIVILNQVGTFKAQVNDMPVTQTFRVTHVWMKTKTGWQLLAEHATDIPPMPKVATVDPKIYDAYVGEYELTPQIHVVISRDGNKLISKSSANKEGIEIFPVDDHTFFFKSDSKTRWTFMKGSDAKMMLVATGAGGEELKAKKVN